MVMTSCQAAGGAILAMRGSVDVGAFAQTGLIAVKDAVELVSRACPSVRELTLLANEERDDEGAISRLDRLW
jgi:hypothetical protein